MGTFDKVKMAAEITKMTMQYRLVPSEELNTIVDDIRIKYAITNEDWAKVQVGLMIVTAREVGGGKRR